MMRCWFACGCISATHCCTSSFRFTLANTRSSLPASILERSSRSLISETRCSPEAWMSLHVLAVALVADRAELLLHHHLGEADDGVERRADLVADLGEEIGFRR